MEIVTVFGMLLFEQNMVMYCENSRKVDPKRFDGQLNILKMGVGFGN
jgi:hypothetical protein